MYRIIIAEDNAALSSVVRFHLERAQHHVTVRPNGQRALEALREKEFDLLITDHQMPKLTGVELVKTLRQGSRNSDIPVVLLTAKRFELEEPELQAKYDIARVFPKPFSPAEIVSVVDEILAATASG